MVPLNQIHTHFTAFIKDGNKWTNETFNSYGEHIETKNYSLETLLLADETQYKIDIDTDGFIGNRVESYIESGEKSAYKVETGDYIMARMGALSGQHPDSQVLLHKEEKRLTLPMTPRLHHFTYIILIRVILIIIQNV